LTIGSGRYVFFFIGVPRAHSGGQNSHSTRTSFWGAGHHYFGRWGKLIEGKRTRTPGDGRQEALAEYKKVAEHLHAGPTPAPQLELRVTVADLYNRFLTAKTRAVEASELSARSFIGCKAVNTRLASSFQDPAGEHGAVAWQSSDAGSISRDSSCS
jgi:hypothetical protein